MGDFLNTINGAVGAPAVPSSGMSSRETASLSFTPQEQAEQVASGSAPGQAVQGDIAELQREIARTDNPMVRGILSDHLAKLSGPKSDFSSVINNAVNGGDSGETPYRMSIVGTSTSDGQKPDLSQIPGRIVPPQSDDAPSALDRIRGGIEASAATATGLAAAPIGAIAGVGYGLTHGYGTAEGADNAGKFAGDVTNSMTYQPRGTTGQEYAGNIGNVLGQLAPLGGMTAEMGALGHLAGPALNDARGAVAAVPGELPVNQRVDPMMDKPRFKMTPDGPVAANAETQLRQQFQAAQATGADARVEPALTQRALPPASTPTGRMQEAASLPVPVQLTAGQSTGDIHQISWEQNNRSKHQDLGNRLNDQNGQLVQNLDAVRKQVAPDVSAVGTDLNQQVVDAYKNKDAPVVADISAKYKALEDANGGNFPLDGKAFSDATAAALDRKLKTNSVPADIQSSLDQFKNGRQMTFQDFESLRSDLADAARTSTDGRQRIAAGIIREQLEAMPLTPEAAALKPLADAARSAAKARFDALDSDPAYKAAISDGVKVGEPSPVADNFVKNYIVKGKTSNVQNAVSNLSNDPINRQLLAAGVVDHLKDAGGLDLRTNAGNLRQSGLNGAIETLDKKAGVVLGPDAAGVVNKIGNVARYTQEQPIGSAVNNSNTLVAGLANASAAGLEGAANYAAHGLPVGTIIRKGLQMRSANNRVNQALNPTGSTKLNAFP